LRRSYERHSVPLLVQKMLLEIFLVQKLLLAARARLRFDGFPDARAA